MQYQTGSGLFNDLTNFFYPVSTSAGGSIGPNDLSGVSALQNVTNNVTFRIVNWNGTGSSGSWYIFDVAATTNADLAVTGFVTAIPTTNPPDAPVLSLVTVTNDQFRFQLTGTVGANYIVQATTNLTAPNWIPLITNAAPFSFMETGVNLDGQRFYSALVAP